MFKPSLYLDASGLLIESEVPDEGMLDKIPEFVHLIPRQKDHPLASGELVSPGQFLGSFQRLVRVVEFTTEKNRKVKKWGSNIDLLGCQMVQQTNVI